VILLRRAARRFSRGRRADIQMPARECEAIVLRSFPLGEGDRLVSFLSRADGRMRGVAGGARKPKSRFGSTLELFSYVRIWFFERETRDLVRINQAELIESFFTAQRDYASELALALVSEVTEAVLGEKEVAEANFRLLLVVARCVKAGADLSIVLAYFALWTVRLGGWLPPLQRCVRCGVSLGGDAFFVRGDGFACGRCRLPGETDISSDALAIGRAMLTSRMDDLVNDNGLRGGSGAVKQLRNVLLDIIEYKMEKRLRTRKLLDESAG